MSKGSFWAGRRVFLTGHTGFKGSWLSIWLSHLEAKVTGYSLLPPTDPSLFMTARVGELLDSVIGDIRDSTLLSNAIHRSRPEIVFHLAAQPLVQESYLDPTGTYSTNVMGTVNLLEAARKEESVRSLVVITTDKCYENAEWPWGYREIDALGGRDPYSSSKACTELVVSAYRASFFSSPNGLKAASARAGNVIGGGDWAKDRLVPDCVRALESGKQVSVRNPGSIRPWQHVLEPLSGYLMLAEKLTDRETDLTGAWNFGPREEDAKSVEWMVRRICSIWGRDARFELDSKRYPHEARYLKLDCSKARSLLGWFPVWGLDKSIEAVIDWHKRVAEGEDARDVTLEQIAARERDAEKWISDSLVL